jgi:hypothetical protein
MSLIFSFKKNSSNQIQYTPDKIFELFFKTINSKYKCELTHFPYTEEFFIPYTLSILNKITNKYIVISYWDDVKDIIKISKKNKKELLRKKIYATCGTNYETLLKCDPISYCVQQTEYEKIANVERIEFNKKEKNDIFFRGSIYGEREILKLLYPIYFRTNKLNIKDFFNEINENKICLCLNGRGGISHRDIEILSAGSVLLRPIIEQKFKNDLIPNFHYIAVDYSNNPKEQFELLIKKFYEIRENRGFLSEISKNGLNWYNENASINSNVRILEESIDFSILN